MLLAVEWQFEFSGSSERYQACLGTPGLFPKFFQPLLHSLTGPYTLHPMPCRMRLGCTWLDPEQLILAEMKLNVKIL